MPSIINVDRMSEQLPIRFRVGNVYKDKYISMYIGDERIVHKKKQIIAPGEMETLILMKKQLEGKSEVDKIVIKIEDE